MNFIRENRILEFKPDTLQYIRKQFNLDKPRQMKEALNVLHDWVQKQDHFKRKDICERLCEFILITRKGSIERTKRQLDQNCTYRTLLPQYFGVYNVKTDLVRTKEIWYLILLPKMTDEYYRVEIMKFKDTAIKSSDFVDLYRYTAIFAEYVRAHDYNNGFSIIVDFSEANLMDYLAQVDLVELRQILTLFIEGFGMRIKTIHLLSQSKFINILISILKQVLSFKVAEKVKVHKTIPEIYEFIPKSILPKDYGGEERCLQDLQDEWFEVLSSEEHLEYLHEVCQYCTDETYRQSDQINEEYAGMPGSFRLLNVD